MFGMQHLEVVGLVATVEREELQISFVQAVCVCARESTMKDLRARFSQWHKCLFEWPLPGQAQLEKMVAAVDLDGNGDLDSQLCAFSNK